MKITIILKNVLLALNQIHVLGSETGLFDGAKKNLEAVIKSLERIEKEESENENQDEQRKDV